ncbi:TPA: hypothetical protein RUX41_000470 [Aeromonas dhakensis]|nr:hypothetical protein [Aeromonas dhakensis]
MFKCVSDQLREALAQTIDITHINTEEDYAIALKLIDELVDNYEMNKKLIELLAISIGGWEDKAYEFAVFNKAVVGG